MPLVARDLVQEIHRCVGPHDEVAHAELTVELAAAMLIGLGGGVLPFHFLGLPQECQLMAPYWGTLPEMMEVLELAQQGRLHMTVERFPLERIAEAYTRMREGTLKGRAIITPHG